MQLVGASIRLSVLRLVVSAMTGATVLAGGTACAGSAGGDQIPPDLFVGDYVVVGRLPDGGAAYSGTARMTAEGGGLVLQLRVGGETASAIGRFEVPSPPVEGLVLRFAEANGAWRSTCLWTIDLDNYPRLTCYKLFSGVDPGAPGLESFFPTGSWPDSAPGRKFGSED